MDLAAHEDLTPRPARSRWLDVLGLVGWLALCYAASGLGAWLTFAGVRDWYPGLDKPAGTPPSWVFGPVWTALYTLMGVAAWLVWRRGSGAKVRGALAWFLAQLALNVAWSGLFFWLRQPWAALVEIGVLWVLIGLTAWRFAAVSRPAAWLLAPYLAWVAYAAWLNLGLWWLNRA